MKLTKERAAENRQQILEAAAQLFRQRGFDDVGVAELMKSVGFTHGGFYNHFSSKEALVAETCRLAIDRANSALGESLASSTEPTIFLHDYLAQYVSPTHRDNPAHGCPLAALAADAARQPAEVQTQFAVGIEALIEILSTYLRTGSTSVRTRAIQLYSELVGAVVLSRAIAAADPELSNEILVAAQRSATSA